MLVELIKQHAFVEAEAGDWEAVAAIIIGLNLRHTPRLCYIIESGEAIEAVGDDGTEVLGYMPQDPNGIVLFNKLSNSVGVVWAHPKTQQWLTWFVSQGRISQAGADALKNLSAPLMYQDVAAEQCRVEYERDAIASAWTTILNEGGINAAVAAGDREALKTALANAIEVL